MRNFNFSGHTHHATNWHNLETCFVLELLNRVSEGLVLELPVRSIGCSHSMHGHPRAASLGHPLLLHQQGPHAHLNLSWGPHAVECEQDPSVKDVLMLLHERSHELSAQIVLLLQSFMSTVGSKVLHPKQTKFTARPIWQQTKRTNKGPEQKWLLWRAWLWRHLKKCSTDRPPVGKLSWPGQLARFERGVPSLASPIRPLGASMYATPSGTLSKSSLFLQPPPCLLKKIQKWGPPLKTHSTNSEILRFPYP